VLVEIGGTVGDIESLPFVEAIRQLRQDVGRENTLYIHLTLVPFIGAAGELKTKPTQHSVRDLRAIGIQPDILLCRTDRYLPPGIKSKIALFCDVEEEAVITAKDVSGNQRVTRGPRSSKRATRRRAYTMSMPIAISTSARPTLKATISSSPKPTRLSESALRRTTSAAGQGTIPPVMPRAQSWRSETLLASW